ncbi:uncharacterized protein LOC140706433 [Pogona vitticeps]
MGVSKMKLSPICGLIIFAAAASHFYVSGKPFTDQNPDASLSDVIRDDTVLGIQNEPGFVVNPEDNVQLENASDRPPGRNKTKKCRAKKVGLENTDALNPGEEAALPPEGEETVVRDDTTQKHQGQKRCKKKGGKGKGENSQPSETLGELPQEAEKGDGKVGGIRHPKQKRCRKKNTPQNIWKNDETPDDGTDPSQDADIKRKREPLSPKGTSPTDSKKQGKRPRSGGKDPKSPREPSSHDADLSDDNKNPEEGAQQEPDGLDRPGNPSSRQGTSGKGKKTGKGRRPGKKVPTRPADNTSDVGDKVDNDTNPGESPDSNPSDPNNPREPTSPTKNTGKNKKTGKGRKPGKKVPTRPGDVTSANGDKADNDINAGKGPDSNPRDANNPKEPSPPTGNSGKGKKPGKGRRRGKKVPTRPGDITTVNGDKVDNDKNPGESPDSNPTDTNRPGKPSSPRGTNGKKKKPGKGRKPGKKVPTRPRENTSAKGDKEDNDINAGESPDSNPRDPKRTRESIPGQGKRPGSRPRPGKKRPKGPLEGTSPGGESPKDEKSPEDPTGKTPGSRPKPGEKGPKGPLGEESPEDEESSEDPTGKTPGRRPKPGGKGPKGPLGRRPKPGEKGPKGPLGEESPEDEESSEDPTGKTPGRRPKPSEKGPKGPLGEESPEDEESSEDPTGKTPGRRPKPGEKGPKGLSDGPTLEEGSSEEDKSPEDSDSTGKTAVRRPRPGKKDVSDPNGDSPYEYERPEKVPMSDQNQPRDPSFPAGTYPHDLFWPEHCANLGNIDPSRLGDLSYLQQMFPHYFRRPKVRPNAAEDFPNHPVDILSPKGDDADDFGSPDLVPGLNTNVLNHRRDPALSKGSFSGRDIITEMRPSLTLSGNSPNDFEGSPGTLVLDTNESDNIDPNHSGRLGILPGSLQGNSLPSGARPDSEANDPNRLGFRVVTGTQQGNSLPSGARPDSEANDPNRLGFRVVTGTQQGNSLPSGARPDSEANDPNRLGFRVVTGTQQGNSLPSGARPDSEANDPNRLGFRFVTGTQQDNSLPSGARPDSEAKDPNRLGFRVVTGTQQDNSLPSGARPDSEAKDPNRLGFRVVTGTQQGNSLPSGARPDSEAKDPNRLGFRVVTGTQQDNSLPSGARPDSEANDPNRLGFRVVTGTQQGNSLPSGARPDSEAKDPNRLGFRVVMGTQQDNSLPSGARPDSEAKDPNRLGFRVVTGTQQDNSLPSGARPDSEANDPNRLGFRFVTGTQQDNSLPSGARPDSEANDPNRLGFRVVTGTQQGNSLPSGARPDSEANDPNRLGFRVMTGTQQGNSLPSGARPDSEANDPNRLGFRVMTGTQQGNSLLSGARPGLEAKDPNLSGDPSSRKGGLFSGLIQAGLNTMGGVAGKLSSVIPSVGRSGTGGSLNAQASPDSTGNDPGVSGRLGILTGTQQGNSLPSGARPDSGANDPNRLGFRVVTGTQQGNSLPSGAHPDSEANDPNRLGFRVMTGTQQGNSLLSGARPDSGAKDPNLSGDPSSRKGGLFSGLIQAGLNTMGGVAGKLSSVIPSVGRSGTGGSLNAQASPDSTGNDPGVSGRLGILTGTKQGNSLRSGARPDSGANDPNRLGLRVMTGTQQGNSLPSGARPGSEANDPNLSGDPSSRKGSLFSGWIQAGLDTVGGVAGKLSSVIPSVGRSGTGGSLTAQTSTGNAPDQPGTSFSLNGLGEGSFSTSRGSSNDQNPARDGSSSTTSRTGGFLFPQSQAGSSINAAMVPGGSSSVQATGQGSAQRVAAPIPQAGSTSTKGTGTGGFLSSLFGGGSEAKAPNRSGGLFSLSGATKVSSLPSQSQPSPQRSARLVKRSLGNEGGDDVTGLVDETLGASGVSSLSSPQLENTLPPLGDPLPEGSTDGRGRRPSRLDEELPSAEGNVGSLSPSVMVRVHTGRGDQALQPLRSEDPEIQFLPLGPTEVTDDGRIFRYATQVTNADGSQVVLQSTPLSLPSKQGGSNTDLAVSPAIPYSPLLAVSPSTLSTMVFGEGVLSEEERRLLSEVAEGGVNAQIIRGPSLSYAANPANPTLSFTIQWSTSKGGKPTTLSTVNLEVHPRVAFDVSGGKLIIRLSLDSADDILISTPGGDGNTDQYKQQSEVIVRKVLDALNRRSLEHAPTLSILRAMHNPAVTVQQAMLHIQETA